MYRDPYHKGNTLFHICVLSKVVSFDYGMRKKDPVNNIQFYSKHDVNKPFSIKKDKVLVEVVSLSGSSDYNMMLQP